MKRSLLFSISALALSFLLGACGEKKETKPFKSGFEGMYVGELPCADCPGIRTNATFLSDSTVAITSLYYDGDNTSETEWGTWTVEGKILKALMPDEITLYYVQLSDSVIMMTDSVGTPSESLAEYYQLTKATPLVSDSFAGKYVMGDIQDPKSYRQNLIITPINENEVNVIVNSEGAGKGCEFSGRGKLVNNQIEVSLNEQHNKMQSTLVIRPNNEKTGLFLFTSTFDDRYDLMYFCGGGGSLAGDYIKVQE
ncbi:hypothetical protein Bcop_1456 [Bacteroides coprosuis DSM 18011]|uniref:Lipoprotein n=1 Tax=Bacteroides coprosuis DSM 18011 TaxID=679937 RepID=F3ZPR4_9BACE|nr:copper resistance protein NlpE [Bacteroides coprosuis]EGJ71651.1 hypothetical protein Bcop_1456 [Bacteroides coprosuis DSM 18011]